jgi:hypothetical protein
MKKFLNKSGVTLLETLVSMGLLGIVSLGVMEVSKSTSNFTKSEKIKADDDSILTMLDAKLSEPTMCNRIFDGRHMGVAGSPENELVSINVAEDDADEEILLKPGEWLDNQEAFNSDSTMRSNLFIESMFIEPIANHSAANIVVNFSKRDRETSELLRNVGVTTLTRKYTVFLTLDSGSNVSNCRGLKTSVNTTLTDAVCTGNVDAKSMIVSGGLCMRRSLSTSSCSLLDGKVSTGIIADGNNYKMACLESRKSFNCMSGFFKKFNATGEAVCDQLTVDEVFVAFNDTSTPATCGAGASQIGQAQSATKFRPACFPIPVVPLGSPTYTATPTNTPTSTPTAAPTAAKTTTIKNSGCDNQCSGKFNAREKFKLWGWFWDKSAGSWESEPEVAVNYETATTDCADWRSGYYSRLTVKQQFMNVCKLTYNDKTNTFDLMVNNPGEGRDGDTETIMWSSTADLLGAGERKSSYLLIDEGHTNRGAGFTCRAIICNCSTITCGCETPVESSKEFQVSSTVYDAGSYCTDGAPAEFQLRGGRLCVADTVSSSQVTEARCDSGADVVW